MWVWFLNGCYRWSGLRSWSGSPLITLESSIVRLGGPPISTSAAPGVTPLQAHTLPFNHSICNNTSLQFSQLCSVKKKVMVDYIFSHSGSYWITTTFRLAMDLLDLGLIWIYLDGMRWEGTGGMIHGRLGLGWPMVCCVGRFGIFMFGVEEGGKGCFEEGWSMLWISLSSFVVMRLKRVGCQVAFAGLNVSGGITGGLYLYCTCVQVGSTLGGGLTQRSSLVPNA